MGPSSGSAKKKAKALTPEAEAPVGREATPPRSQNSASQTEVKLAPVARGTPSQPPLAIPRVRVIESYEEAVGALGAAPLPDLLCSIGLHPVGSGALYDTSTALFTGDRNALPASVLEQHDGWMASVTPLACGHTACSVCVASGGATVKCHCGVLTAVPSNATANASLQELVAMLPVHTPTTAWAKRLLGTAFRNALKQSAAEAGLAGPSQEAPTASQKAASAAATLCGYCEEAPEVVRCAECSFGLCATCRDTIHSKGRFKSHTVTSLHEGSSDHPSSAKPAPHAEALAPVAPATCTEHANYPLELYCSKCEQCICLRCHYSGLHKGHSTTPLGELLGAIRVELQQQESKLRDGATVLQNAWSRIGKAAATVESEAQAIRESLVQQFGAVRSLIDDAENKALAEVEKYTQDRRAAVDADVGEACRLAFRLRGASVGMRLAMGGPSASGSNAVATLLKHHDAITRQGASLVASDPHVHAALHSGAHYAAALDAVCSEWESLRHVAVCGSQLTSSGSSSALPSTVAHAIANVTSKAGGRFVASTLDASDRLMSSTLSALHRSTSPAKKQQQHHNNNNADHEPVVPVSRRGGAASMMANGRTSSDHLTVGQMLQKADESNNSGKSGPAPLQRAGVTSSKAPALQAVTVHESMDPPSHFGFATQEPSSNLFGGGARGAAAAMHLQAVTAQWSMTQQQQQQQQVAPSPAASTSGASRAIGNIWPSGATEGAPSAKAHRSEISAALLMEASEAPPQGLQGIPPQLASPPRAAPAAVGPKAAMAAQRNTLNFGPPSATCGRKGGKNSGNVPSPLPGAPSAASSSSSSAFQLHI